MFLCMFTGNVCYMETTGQPQLLFLKQLYTCLLDGRYLTDLGLTFRLGLLVREAPGSACLCFPSWRSTSMYHHFQLKKKKVYLFLFYVCKYFVCMFVHQMDTLKCQKVSGFLELELATVCVLGTELRSSAVNKCS